jgi:hypothetical protein
MVMLCLATMAFGAAVMVVGLWSNWVSLEVGREGEGGKEGREGRSSDGGAGVWRVSEREREEIWLTFTMCVRVCVCACACVRVHVRTRTCASSALDVPRFYPFARV